MKEKTILIILIIITVALSSATGVLGWYNIQPNELPVQKVNLSSNVSIESNSNYIGEARAIAIMKSVSPDGAPGATAFLTTFMGRPMYKISWENDNYGYVDAVTGAVYDRFGASSHTDDDSDMHDYDDYDDYDYFDDYDDYDYDDDW